MLTSYHFLLFRAQLKTKYINMCTASKKRGEKNHYQKISNYRKITFKEEINLFLIKFQRYI